MRRSFLVNYQDGSCTLARACNAWESSDLQVLLGQLQLLRSQWAGTAIAFWADHWALVEAVVGLLPTCSTTPWQLNKLSPFSGHQDWAGTCLETLEGLLICTPEQPCLIVAVHQWEPLEKPKKASPTIDEILRDRLSITPENLPTITSKNDWCDNLGFLAAAFSPQEAIAVMRSLSMEEVGRFSFVLKEARKTDQERMQDVMDIIKERMASGGVQLMDSTGKVLSFNELLDQDDLEISKANAESNFDN